MHSQRKEVYKSKLVFNITYYPIFSKLKNFLLKILLLGNTVEVLRMFQCFEKGKSLKKILVRAKVPPLKTEEGFYGSCNKPSYEIYKNITKPHQLESSSTKRIYSIRPHSFNCASKNVIYFFTSKTCHEQCTGSTEEFQTRFNNYRYSHRNFLKHQKVKQESFRAHFT